MPQISLVIASMAGFMSVWLALQVISRRRKYKVSMGDGGIEELGKAIRAHANFSEYVPLSLILLVMSELNRAPQIAVSVFGLLILLGRLFHAYAFLGKTDHFKFRVLGMKISLNTLIALSAFNVALFVWNFFSRP